MEWKKIESGMDKKRTKPFEAFSLSRCTTYNIMTKKKRKDIQKVTSELIFQQCLPTIFYLFCMPNKLLRKRRGFIRHVIWDSSKIF